MRACMHGAPSQLLPLLLALLAARHGAGQANLNFYSIDWTAVPVTPPATNLTFNCICDLSPDTCSPNCCCDGQCPVGVTAVAQSAGQCLPQGPPDETLDYCAKSSSVQKVNLPSSSDFYSVQIQPADNLFFDQLLCVVDSSNPNLGPTYPDPATGNVGSNPTLGACPAVESLPSRAAYYQINSPIYVIGPSPTATASRPLTLPYPVWSVECMDDYQPGWLQPLPSSQQLVFSSCIRNLNPGQTSTNQTLNTDSLAALCGLSYGPLSALSYANLAFLLVPAKDSTSTVTATVQTLYQDPLTGALSALSTNAPAPTYVNGTCLNMLQSLNITFFYSIQDEGGNGTAATMQLVEVTMQLVITDFNTSQTSATVIRQAARLDFVQMGTLPTIVQQNSGNPGYLNGFPLMAGEEVQYTDPVLGPLTAIQRYTFGFPLPTGDLNGECSPLGLAPTRYNYNGSSTCVLTMNLAMFNSFCNTQSPTVLLENILGSLWTALRSNLVYVGIWGNSNTSNVNQWLQITQTNTNFPSLAPFPSDRSCSNVITGYDLQVVTGVAYAANNLQRKVLYVNLCYRTETWYFPMAADASFEAPFFMKSTVGFVPLSQAASPSIKPHPPLAIPLPEEIFYPFVTGGASSVQGLGMLWLAAQAAAVFAGVALLCGLGV